MGGGNGQKSKTARERNLEKNKAAKGSQLETNKKAMSIQLSVAKFGFRNGTIVLIPTTAHEKQLSPLVVSVQTVLHQALDSYPMLGIGIRTEPGLCSIFFSGKTSIVSAVLNCLML
ncbi:unnamed protein product [Miscanthus lutarioriparius]|uniref:Small EDRK-rich factor-like N-terminal domain-containing protein n=1 Tax=Miscanthus lutarioriparius TaxID=422564 RepID=A0A811MGD5_9POAL|nr:unnamed protein product [Miscanthus lutarioriparius]